MFQPTPRMRDEDWLALPLDELDALTMDSVGVPIESPDDAPRSVPDPFLDSPSGLAWEDFERGLLAKRQREAALCVLLLDAQRAALVDADERYGPGGRRQDVFPHVFAAETALALDVSESMAVTLLHHLELVERWFPATWAAFRVGRADLRAIQTVARQSEGLDLDAHAADWDRAVVDAFERVPGSRLKRHLHRVRERLQADTAAERRAEATARRCAEVDVLPDGMAILTLTGPAEDLLAVDDALQRAAVAVHGREGETRSITNLRYDLARDLLLGGIAAAPAPDGSSAFTMTVPDRPVIVPTVTVTIPVLTLLGQDTAPAELDGYGPIDPATARRLAGQATCWDRVLTHPVTGFRLTLDATRYRPGRALRRWLQLRDGTCRFPGCTRPAVRSDVDHQREWHEGGESEVDNLAHLCRKHHLIKSTGVWRTRHDPGTDRITWTSPAGRPWVSEPAPPSAPAPAALLDLEPVPF